MLGTRGVIQGGAEYVAEHALGLSSTGRRMHQHDGLEPHSHPHPHPHVPAPPVIKVSVKRPNGKAPPRSKTSKGRR
jgi:hypothetical protein